MVAGVSYRQRIQIQSLHSWTSCCKRERFPEGVLILVNTSVSTTQTHIHTCTHMLGALGPCRYMFLSLCVCGGEWILISPDFPRTNLQPCSQLTTLTTSLLFAVTVSVSRSHSDISRTWVIKNRNNTVSLSSCLHKRPIHRTRHRMGWVCVSEPAAANTGHPWVTFESDEELFHHVDTTQLLNHSAPPHPPHPQRTTEDGQTEFIYSVWVNVFHSLNIVSPQSHVHTELLLFSQEIFVDNEIIFFRSH